MQTKQSSLRESVQNWMFNNPAVLQRLMGWWPPYWGTGIGIREIAPDWSYLVVQMKMRFYNRNMNGSHFGGSLLAMTDPFYALLLAPRLGSGYVIWDKSTSIDFLKPGYGTVTVRFEWSDAELQETLRETASGEKYQPVRELPIINEAGETIAVVRKQLHIRRKRQKKDQERRSAV